MTLKIKTKITLIVVAILFITIGTQSLVSSYVFSNEYSDAMKAEAVAIARGLKVQLDRLLKLGLSLQDITGFEKQCQETVESYEKISNAMVISNEGEILFHNDPNEMNTMISDSKILEAVKSGQDEIHVSSINSEQFIIITIPIINNNGGQIGAIIVDFPEQYISQKTNAVYFRSVVMSFIFFSLAVFLMIFSITIWITKPLKRLTTVIQDIRKSGNLDKGVEIKSKDELGELAVVFNQMTEELKNSRYKMERYNKNLKEMVEKRTEKLVQSNLDLKRFAYISSHHLQEPIRTIVSYLQLLEKQYEGKLDSEAKEYLEYVINGAFLMKKQINDILKYHEVSSQKRIYQSTDCELILKQSLENLHDIIQTNGAVITHEPLPTVIGHKWQLQLLFNTIINNALMYNDKNVPKVYISVKRKKNNWQFSVKDNGIGIDKKFFDRIFEIFERLHTQDVYSGTGIGLAICKKIIQRHNGKIWIKSKLGSGSKFYFTIPILNFKG